MLGMARGKWHEIAGKISKDRNIACRYAFHIDTSYEHFDRQYNFFVIAI